MDAVAIDRRIRGEGTTAETDWRDWLADLQPPGLSIDQLPANSQRVVVVSPHPDDEVLACGGLLALHARRGGEAIVVAVTDGEASHRDDPSWPANRLASARRLERLRGLARLGLRADAVTRLALRDSGVAAQRSSIEAGLRALLRPSDCVVTTWRSDGHPDHDATGAATARVCTDIGCRLLEAPVWMWHWGVPGDARVPWSRLRTLPLPPDMLAAKAAALGEHATQLAPRGASAPVLGPAILARAARAAEYFLV